MNSIKWTRYRTHVQVLLLTRYFDLGMKLAIDITAMIKTTAPLLRLELGPEVQTHPA